jgi:6-phosphogluconolactonase/glucosamine-6-phosphate isomerase/deaminase
MNIEVLADSASVAQRAAFVIAEEAQGAIGARGRFVMAVSGGQTPCPVAALFRIFPSSSAALETRRTIE